MKSRKNRRRRVSLLRATGIATGVVLALSILVVLGLRWLPPPGSSFMLQDDLSGVPLRYRWVPLESISPYAATAVVAAEDQNFAEHKGFDFEAIARAWSHNSQGGPLRGGSTITQQVAKNLFLWPGRSFLRKGLEAYFTVLIEVLWPKPRILEVYLNIAQFGDGIYGMEAASEAFFGKPAAHLNAREAALLAAVLPNPRRLRVEAPSAYVYQRQTWILAQMPRLGGRRYLVRFE